MQLARSLGNLHRRDIFYISPEAKVIFQKLKNIRRKCNCMNNGLVALDFGHIQN